MNTLRLVAISVLIGLIANYAPLMISIVSVLILMFHVKHS
jgi:hypothetical protein